MTGEGENGRQSSNQITLVGYAEFATVLREGGTLPSPKTAPPRGQNDQGDTLDKTSMARGHHVSTAAGHTVSTLMNSQSNPHVNKKEEAGSIARDWTDGNLGEQLPFDDASHPLLMKAERFGVDPQLIIRKFAVQWRRRRIDDANAYIAKMVAEDIAKQHSISEEQALQWFSMPEPVATHLHQVATRVSLLPSQRGSRTLAAEPHQGDAQPKVTSSLASSRRVTGETR